MGEYTSNYSLYLPSLGEQGWGNLVNQNFVQIDQLLPIGSIVSFAGSVSPSGWLICNGQSVSRTEYSKLYSVLGTVYGSGDGSTTFNLPDLRGRVIVGVSDNHLLSETGGEETHTLTIEEMPSHNHSYTGVTAGSSASTSSNGEHTHTANSFGTGVATNVFAYGDSGYGNARITTTNSSGTHTHDLNNHTHNYSGLTLPTGGDQSHNNMQPYLVINYIIKY